MAVTVFKQTDKPENTFGHKMQQDGRVSEGVRTLLAIITQHPGLCAPLLAEKMQTSAKMLTAGSSNSKKPKKLNFLGLRKRGLLFDEQSGSISMMRIAILGATSQIARDLIVSFSAAEDKHPHLFARRSDEVTKWLASIGLSGRYPVDDSTGLLLLMQ